ncbi:MAG: ATPase domain-containing protein, partial [Planctomycetota bacterium]
GVSNGENVLFITLGETADQIQRDARRLGDEVEDINFLDLSPGEKFFEESQDYDIFSPAEVERNPTAQKIKDTVKSLRPSRVFVDSITQFRYLTSDEYQFHQQVLSFIQFLTRNDCTVLFASEGTEQAPDEDLQFLADGVFSLSLEDRKRSLIVTKFRGSDFYSGQHAVTLGADGMKVYPDLPPTRRVTDLDMERIPFGIAGMDRLTHGGLNRGTTNIISGPAGVGKTTLSMQVVAEVARGGERSALFQFDESRATLIARSSSVRIPIQSMLDDDKLAIYNIEPLQYSPLELAGLVRKEIEEHDSRVVVVDSISGYKLCLGGHQELIRHIHGLSRYLKNMGVTSLFVNEIKEITGSFMATQDGLSYMADAIIFMQYMEWNGEVHKAIGMLKNRVSNFEKTLCRFDIDEDGIHVGEPLRGLREILTGAPEMQDDVIEGEE